MKGSPSLIHTSWLRPFAEFFERRDVSLTAYLDVARIENELIESGEGWITKRQLYRFLNEIARGEDIPELGFVVGELITPDYLGTIGEAIAGTEVLGEALRVFCRLVGRHVEGNRVWLEEGEIGEVWLFNKTSDRTRGGGGDIADHAGLMSLINLVRMAADPGWYPERMTLQAGVSANCKRCLPWTKGRDLKHRCEATGLAFPAAFLLREVRPEWRSSSAKMGTGRCGGLLDERESGSLPAKLRRLLDAIIGIGGLVPTAKLMAYLCSMSPRTFHRRLQDCGKKYQELLDESRFERAHTLLRNSDMSIKDLASELGYSGPNNFIRAFRRMSGDSPARYRRRETE